MQEGACQPSNLLGQLQYTTAGSGLVACNQGADVIYPEGAPGFQDDPTGSSLANSASQVLPDDELLSCMLKQMRAARCSATGMPLQVA